MSGAPPALNAEWSLLLAACSSLSAREKCSRLRSALRAPLRWKALFTLADSHGALSLLYKALFDLEGDVPAEEMAWLKQRYQANLRKALLLSRELIRILDRLSTLEIEVMPYKGLALAEALYQDITLRHSGDMDLLIRAPDLARVRDAVGELGYTPHVQFSAAEERSYLKSGYECVFDSAAGRNLLEVQWALQPSFYAIDFDMDGLFQRAMTVFIAEQPVKTPSHEDLLLVLSAHAAKHAWDRLIWLCDIAQLLHLPALDWNWIASQARKLGMLRILGVTMMLANRLFEVSIPAAAQATLPQDRETQILANEILDHILSEKEYDVESVSYFRLMMRLRERPWDRMRLLERLLFTPGPGEWQVVRLPSALFPLYRLIRLSRVAARLVGA